MPSTSFTRSPPYHSDLSLPYILSNLPPNVISAYAQSNTIPTLSTHPVTYRISSCQLNLNLHQKLS